jgi:diguanylate cyclase (GGDEF)-like protein/PAS domain S-box-containing protein
MSSVLPVARSSRPTLATWLFVSVLGATLAAVLTCTLIIDRFVRDEARVKAAQFLQSHADALRDALDRGMAQNYEQVRVIGQLDQVSASTDPAAIRRALEQVHASFPQFAWLGLAARDGHVIASIDGLLQGVSVASRPWYSGAQHAMYVGDVHAAVLLAQQLPATAEPWRFVDVATPVYAPDGSLRGILGAHLSWNWAQQIKHDLVDAPLMHQQAEAMIVAADGTVLLGSAALQGRKLPPANAADVLTVESRTHGAGRYPGLGWNVVLRQPERVALADYRALEVRMHVAVAALCLLFVPLLLLLARRLSTPLRELGMQLEVPIDAPVPARHHPLYREADLLGQALDRHAQRQREDAARLRDLNAGLEARVVERTAALGRTNDELTRAVRDRGYSEQRLRDITDAVPAVIACFDADERCTFANAQAAQILRIGPESPGRNTLRAAMGARYDEYKPALDRALSGEHTVIEGQLDIGGERIDFQTHCVPDIASDGRVAGIYILAHDQTALMNAERKSAAGEQRLRTITDNVPVLISYLDKHERYQFCNGTYRTWLGLEPEQLIGRAMADILVIGDYPRRRENLQRTLAGERTELDIEATWGGVTRNLHMTYVPDIANDGTVEGAYVLASDITAMKEAEAQLARQARTDSLTGLPNRHAFNEQLAEALSRSRRNAQAVALFFLDIDKFKTINDTLGHGAGDGVLKLFSQRLAASVRETDAVARLAGDEFVVLLEGLRSPAEPELVALKILAAMNRPFQFDGLSLAITTSIGIAYHADGRASPAELLAQADKALYEAKNGGRNTFRLAAA